MKLYFVECYREADWPSSGTFYLLPVAASNESEAISVAAGNGHEVFGKCEEVNLEKIARMRKPREIVLS